MEEFNLAKNAPLRGHFDGVYEFFYATVMTLTGHFSAQAPQLVHFSGSMEARKSVTVLAPVGQTLVHIIQPMQPAEQTLRTTAPLSWLEQRTVT